MLRHGPALVVSVVAAATASLIAAVWLAVPAGGGVQQRVAGDLHRALIFGG